MRITPLRARLWGAVLCCWLVPHIASAHGVHASYTAITVSSNRLEAVFTFNLADLSAHFRADTNGDGRLSPEEVLAATPALYEFVKAHAALLVNGSGVPLRQEHAALTQDVAHQEFLNLAFSVPLRRPAERIALGFDTAPFETFGQTYTNLVKLTAAGQTQQAVLSIQHPRQEFSLSQSRSLADQLAQFTRLGMQHIFLGYDHLAFLLALILLGGRLTSLFKIVSAFTVAHSVTLILAALRIVSLPSRLVESGIALSIVYIAAENVVVKTVDHRWVITGCFGLVHGFGFANVLRDLGLPTQGLVASLLAFNVGVELGQVAIVALLFPLTLWIARQPFRRPVTVALSGAILLLGAGWFLERVFSLSFMPF